MSAAAYFLLMDVGLVCVNVSALCLSFGLFFSFQPVTDRIWDHSDPVLVGEA